MKDFKSYYTLLYESIFACPDEAEVKKRKAPYLAEVAKKLKSEGILRNGRYHFKGDVDINGLGLTSITDLGIRFGDIGGCFYCFDNLLKDLNGSPKKVYGDFDCYDNLLTSLIGGPEQVGGDYYCWNNRLVDLKYLPIVLGGGLDCSINILVSLEGCPYFIYGDFDCSRNRLKDLEGGPGAVAGNYICGSNFRKFRPAYVNSICLVSGDVRQRPDDLK